MFISLTDALFDTIEELKKKVFELEEQSGKV